MSAEPGVPAEALETRSELRWGSALLGLVGALFAVSGVGSVYRGLFATGFEPGVESLGGVTAGELAASNPELSSYIAHLHVNGGILAALVGAAILVLVWFGVRRGQRWSLATTVALPVVYLVFLVVMHTTASFHYETVEHLGAVGIGLPLLATGAILSYLGIERADTSDRRSPEEGA